MSLYNGETVPLRVSIGSDALTDIAVLKIETDLSLAAISFGDPSLLRPGDQVFAIGQL
ncbi:hypothetical protein KHA80_21410 [Anaerobacillus sp. HL2]|nr:hypothetical protein KHA80_21410 [Anaerobacillus sp. HL2]